MNTFIAMTFIGLLSLSFQSSAQQAVKTDLDIRLADIENSIMELTKEQGSQTARIEEQSKKFGCQIGSTNQIHIDLESRTILGSNAIITTARDLTTGHEVIKHIAQKQQTNPVADALAVATPKESQDLIENYNKTLKADQNKHKNLSKDELDKSELEGYKEYEMKKQSIAKQQIEINQFDF